MTSTLEEELREHARWRLKPRWESRRGRFETLVRNEFLSADEHQARMDGAVARLASYAMSAIPLYRERLGSLGLSAADVGSVAGLRHLPVLTKRDIQDRARDLRPTVLPESHRLWGVKRSSGTTGQPTRVPHTVSSILMQSALAQRDARWARHDPMGTLALIRLPTDLPRDAQGQLIATGVTMSRDNWGMIGNCFHTGPSVAYSVVNPVDEQVRWLKAQHADYLNSHSARLEHLALAFQDEPLQRLKGIKAVGQQLTAGMRARVEHAFGAPVSQNYGLNEVGLVAARCQEGGRYHVHTEHCLVEVVDEQGEPCAPGQRGRLLVTAFNNPAMPLLRYDADDMAIACESPCPCGRTLPAFGEIIGRYGRTVLLPPGTLPYWLAVEAALGLYAPRDLIRPLRQFQLHQFRDLHFELRLVLAGPTPAGLVAHLQQFWWEHGGNEGWPLEVRIVDEIPRPPGGKFQSFTSDFAPQPAQGEQERVES